MADGIPWECVKPSGRFKCDWGPIIDVDRAGMAFGCSNPSREGQPMDHATPPVPIAHPDALNNMRPCQQQKNLFISSVLVHGLHPQQAMQDLGMTHYLPATQNPANPNQYWAIVRMSLSIRMAVMWDETIVEYASEPTEATGWQPVIRQVREMMCVKGFISTHGGSNAGGKTKDYSANPEYKPLWQVWEGRTRIDERVRNHCRQELERLAMA